MRTYSVGYSKRRAAWCAGAGLALVAVAAGVAHAQTYENGGAELRFEVFDPDANAGAGAWTSSISAVPGQQVEWRTVVNYTGTRTDLYSLGEVLYQPTILGVDNVGTTRDELGAWRNGGNTSNGNGILSTAEGNDGGALASYGRVNYGGTSTSVPQFSTITSFRHSSGSDGAPPGEWIRMAGVFVTQWPRDLSGPVPPLDVVANDLNFILRGISAQQQSQASVPQFHIVGVHDLVLFRQALIVSTDHSPGDVLSISSFRESQRRIGSASGASESDDRRYIAWRTSSTDAGGQLGHRSGDATYLLATITIVPTPGAGLVVATAFALSASRRRRRRGP